jgi:hypothetical protein
MTSDTTYIELLRMAHESLNSKDAKMVKLEDELETERCRLAACGVVALANTKESAEKQRVMMPKYHSASLDDVIRAVDSEMDLRDKIAELEKELEAAMTFNVDVVRCLSRIASVENHNEVPAYIDMSRRCINTIEAKQAKLLKDKS